MPLKAWDHETRPLMNNDAAVTVMQALMSRRSIRAFLPDAVDETALRQIFDHARRAPSGSNTQPWKAYVLTGEARDALSRKILAVYNDPEADKLHEEEFEIGRASCRERVCR